MNRLKSFGGGSMQAKLEQMKKLGLLLQSFSGNAQDFVEKCEAVVNATTEIITVVSEMIASNHFEGKSLLAKLKVLKDNVLILKKEVEEDLATDLKSAKELLGLEGDADAAGDGKDKDSKAAGIVSKIGKIVKIAFEILSAFKKITEDIECIIKAGEDGDVETVAITVGNIKNALIQIKDKMGEIKDIITGADKEETKEGSNKAKKQGVVTQTKNSDEKDASKSKGSTKSVDESGSRRRCCFLSCCGKGEE